MKVSESMTSDVRTVSPMQTVSEAAQLMVECDAGALPVVEGDRLVGMITDRDIVLRAVAHQRSPSTLVNEVMTQEVLYCYEDEELESVARNMGQHQVRRLPVVNKDKELVGIVSLGDLATEVGSRVAGRAIADISRSQQVEASRETNSEEMAH